MVELAEAFDAARVAAVQLAAAFQRLDRRALLDFGEWHREIHGRPT